MQFNEYVRQYSKVSKEVQRRCANNLRWLVEHHHDIGYSTSNKFLAFCAFVSNKNGIGDWFGSTDPDELPEGLLDTRAQLIRDITPNIPVGRILDDRMNPNLKSWGDFITFCQTEMMWHSTGRPYYDVYPIVYEHMINNIELSNWTWNSIKPPFSPLLLKFPVGREPYGIASMLVRKSYFGDDPKSHKLGWGVDPADKKPAAFRLDWMMSSESCDQGNHPNHKLWDAMAEESMKCQLEIEVQFAPRFEDATYSAVSLLNTSDDSSLLTSLDNSRLRNLMMCDLFNNRTDHPTATEVARLNAEFYEASREQGVGGTLDFSGVPPFELDCWKHIDMQPNNPEHNEKVCVQRDEFHKFIYKMVILLSEIHKTPGMIEDAVLARDRDEYADANERRKQRLADKAARRTGSKGWSIGRQQQEQSDKNKHNPHWVDPFLRNQACGPRHSERKIIEVKGHFRGVASIEQVPTGFEGHKQPEQPEYKYRPPISPALRARVFARDKNTCRTCGRKPKDGIKLEAGHVVSHKNGGKASMDNLITQCNICNSGQSSRNIKKGQLA